MSTKKATKKTSQLQALLGEWAATQKQLSRLRQLHLAELEAQEKRLAKAIEQEFKAVGGPDYVVEEMAAGGARVWWGETTARIISAESLLEAIPPKQRTPELLACLKVNVTALDKKFGSDRFLGITVNEVKRSVRLELLE